MRPLPARTPSDRDPRTVPLEPAAAASTRSPERRPRASSRPCSRARPGGPPSQAACLLGILLLLTAATAFAQPIVNGLFYGDGDDAVYSPYAASNFGSVLYNYYDVGTNTMYVALVVNHAVNDNVCSPKANKDYTGSAVPPWNQHRSCKRRSDSEFASWTLECAPGSPRSWSWQQALGCAQTAGPPQSTWVSDSTCGPSSPAADWPPGVEATSTTSWVTNINTYQAAAPATRAWNLYAFGNDLDTGWKSPFVASAPNDVTQVPGYPTYSDTDGGGLFFEWEWSGVYEWSVDLGPGGADCGNNVVVFITGNSHHSPGKHGSQDDPFDPPTGDQTFSDFGDLPDSYLTTKAAGGARHYIKVNAPYLGQHEGAEEDGQPTADASGDGSEEDGVTANVTSDWTSGSTQTFDVVVSRAPVGGALLGAWFDWNGDGDFADPGEFVSWSGLTDGTHTLSITVDPNSQGFDWQFDSLAARFRLFSSAATAPGGSLDAGDYAGTATDGEVEDYNYPPGSLPVSLNAFSSEPAAGGGLTVRWQTATETDNVGFELLGRVRGRWMPLSDFVASQGMNSALPQSYEIEIRVPEGMTGLELVDYDTRGRPERFGTFRPGASYGEFQAARRIDWTGPRDRREDRLRQRGFTPSERPGTAFSQASPAGSRWRKLERPGARSRSRGPSATAYETADGGTIRLATGPLTHVAVTEHGIQRVSYESLRDAGLDLAGVREGAIAVTWRGQPVARWVAGTGTFGPGSWIEFVGRPPQGDDALYLRENLYQVSVDPSRARAASHAGAARARRPSLAYRQEAMVDHPAMFHRQSPTGDPWIEQPVLVRRGSKTVNLEIPVQGPVLEGPSRLVVGLGTVTDLPDINGPGGEAIPEHNVELWFSGPGSSFEYVTSATASGQQDWRIEADLPRGRLQPGINRLQLRFTTDYFFSLVLIDRYGVSYPGPYLGPELDFASDPEADGYRVDGFTTPSIAAYAEDEDGTLTRIAPRVSPAGGGYAAELRQVDAARFWVSEDPHAPAVFTTGAPPDLLADPAGLLVITGSSFVGTEALEAYVEDRSELSPLVIDVEDIYNGVGFGMALPGAITDYLKIRDRLQPFTHVQLVGTDCYDRLNYLSECVSFIPLPTAPVGVTTYSPSQNRLVDLDGDGVGDKAVGQFSVRDEAELATIVEKGRAWTASWLTGAESALLVAEETDGLHDFAAQTDRLRRRLGWRDTDMIDLANHPDIATAREALRTSLDQGRTITVFSGHSSPTVWGFRSLLTASDVDYLTNVGLPTLMVPLACETTYDISPDADVLGHQLLYSGGQGALAVSGAVALSSLVENEHMAGLIIDGLKAGLTLGEAVQAGREALGTEFQTLQDNWMTQGDVAARVAP